MNAAPFPYRLAACDLDGTLLGPDKEISTANADAVRQLQGRGVRFVIASGGGTRTACAYYRELGLDGWMISCSGALIQDPHTEETLREVLIPAALADELVARGQAAGFTVIYYHRDHLYVNARTHWTELYESRVGERAESFPGDLRELHGEAALKIVWYAEPETLKTLRPKLEEEYRDRFTVLATDAENLEFLAPAANKADSLAALCGQLRRCRRRKRWLLRRRRERCADVALGRVGRGGGRRGRSAAKSAARLVGPPGAKESRFARAVEAVFAR